MWWRRHNGPLADAPPRSRDVGFREIYPLDITADIHRSVLNLDEDDGFGLVNLRMIRPVGGPPWLYFRCDGARDAPVPVYAQDDIELPREILPSIGELVVFWTDAIERRYLRVTPDGNWQLDPDRAPTPVPFGLP
jgi:hypothetical protein